MSEVDVGESAREVYLRLAGHTQVGHGSHWDARGRVMPLPPEQLDVDLPLPDLRTAQFIRPKQLRNPEYRTELINRIRDGDSYISRDVFEILHSFGYDIEYKQPENPSHYILSNDERPAWKRIISQGTLDNCV